MQPASLSTYEFDEPDVLVERIINNVEKAVVGKRDAVELAVIALLCGGHLLLEDVPGVGKTMLVRALSQTVDCTFKRIQCTPDMLPSDVTGVSIYNPRSGQFEFRRGPLFAHFVLADELNRTSPKTQSALLEAMEERQVTADGETYRLPEPFLLFATQNPFGHEGTYELPEAQLDRFLLCVRLGYPAPRDEVDMLSGKLSRPAVDELRPVVMREELLELQRRVRGVFVDDTLKPYIVGVTGATRIHPDVELGASPRASIALMRASQAKAFTRGRRYVVPDDIKAVAEPLLAHRLMLTADARLAGKRGGAVVQAVVASVPVPGVRAGLRK